MSFLYPQFLFALSALAIPVIIHLFNFRRYKKILFTNVRFLANIEQESKSRNRLRQLLLLLLRLLALTCLILAFAQPYFPHKKSMVNPGKNFVAIYVDNSFSMTNAGSQGDLLQIAKKKAEEAARSYRESDAYQLITNDFELRHRRWANRAEFLQSLNEVNVSPVSRSLNEVYKRVKEGFRTAESGNKFIYFFTDFQQGMADLPKIPTDSSIVFNAVPLKAATRNNIYIDSAWFESSVWQVNQANTVITRIVNASESDIQDATITLLLNSKQKALANFNIAAGAKAEVKVNFTISEEGTNNAQLQINDYPITFDDTWYFSFPVAKYLPVLAINGEKHTNGIERVFKAEEAFQFKEIAQGGIDYSSLNENNFIVLNEIEKLSSGLSAASKSYMDNGGNILLIPASLNADAESYNQLLGLCESGRISGLNNLQIAVGDIDLKNPFFHNIFDEVPKNINLPEAKKYFKLETTAGSRATNLLRFNNGDPFITMAPVGKGFLFTCLTPLEPEWGNLANHALFLPMLYKMATYHSSLEKISYTIGKDNYLRVPSGPQEDKEHIYKLKRNNFEVIPPQRSFEDNLNLYVEGLIKEAGFYSLTGIKQEKNISSPFYAFNYDRQESVMKFLDESEIKNQGAHLNLRFLDVNKASLTTEIQQIRQGSGLWKLFIILGLAFILAETLLIRIYRQ
jgi:hypothetical protein